MAIFMYVLLIVSGWFLKKNKGLYILMSAFMFVLLAFRTSGADYDIYLSRFNFHTQLNSFTEVLFTAYVDVFHGLNLTFDNFIQVSALLCIVIPLFFIFKKSNYPCRVLSMYMLYSFPIDGLQVRSSLAFGIVLVGLIYLMENNKKSELYYLIATVIASMIHTSSIVYALFLPVNRFSKKRMTWKVGSMFLIEIIAVFFLNNILLEYLTSGSILNMVYLLSHAANDNYRIFMYISKSLAMFAIEFGLLELYRRNCLIKAEENIKRLDFVTKLNFITLFVIPLYFLTVDLYRIQRYLFLFTLIIIFGTKLKISKNKNIFLLLSVLGFGIIYFLYFIRSTDYTATIVPLLLKNSLI